MQKFGAMWSFYMGKPVPPLINPNIMKHLLHLLAACICLHSHFMLRAQDAPLLRQSIRLQPIEASMRVALQEIESAGGFSFSYSDWVNPDREVRLPGGQYALSEWLEMLFPGQNMSYVIKGGKIILRPMSQPHAFTLSGYIRDQSSGENLIGAVIRVADQPLGAQTNAYGFFSLTLPVGSYSFELSYLGYERLTVAIDLDRDLSRNFDLQPKAMTVQEVVISESPAEKLIRSPQMSLIGISSEEIKALPALMGEADVLKSIQLLPGVKSMGEGSSGLFVRGGNLDQNLILLDEAPVYNPAHILGFLSVFNPDAIQDLSLYKGNFPARYGGRLSSLVYIHMKEGNSKGLRGAGGLSPLASRLSLEGPISERSTFMISGRRSFLDLLQIQPDNSKVYFYDLNAKANYRISDKDRLYVSGYFGRDLFSFRDEYEVDWGNTTATLRWNHLFSDKLFANFTALYSRYHYKINDFETEVITFNWRSAVEDMNLKGDFSWYLNPRNTLRFGFNSIYHRFEPGRTDQSTDNGGNLRVNIPESHALEHALYLSNEQRIGSKLALYYGLRYSLFQNIGPGTVFQYNAAHQVVDSAQYRGGKIFHHSQGLEPRLTLRYQTGRNNSLKTSYARTRQYLQLLQNSTSAFTAFEVWLPSGPNLAPQIADQYSLGYVQSLQGGNYEFEVETYYKALQNRVDYRDHAQILQNRYIEGEVRTGDGEAYGVELLLRKREGRLRGFIAYTWSRALLTLPEVNGGKTYPARYDKPHDIAIALNYHTRRSWQLAANWVYLSGGATTLPVGNYDLLGTAIPIYSSRNGERLPDYHRLDLSATLGPKAKNLQRRWKSSWNFGLYNAYGRKNALAIDYLQQHDSRGISGNLDTPTNSVATKTYLFTFTPSVTYNFEF